MIRVKRIGHATLQTPDLEQQADYYQQVIGLVEVGREADRVFLATTTGLLSLVLETGAEPRCISQAFEVSRELSLGEIAADLAAGGVASATRASKVPGIADVQAFSDPSGITVELFPTWDFVPASAPAPGIGPNKLGHLNWYGADPQALADFYGRVLGFRISDWVGDFIVFMRCGLDHHTVAFMRGEPGVLHHLAFELQDASQLHRACELLGLKKQRIIWGPVRHGPGHNLCVYHRDPDGHVVELYTDMDRMVDEELGYFEPRPWHADRPQKPRTWVLGGGNDKWGLPPGPGWTRAT